MKRVNIMVFIGFVAIFYSTGAAAQLTNQGMLDQVVEKFAIKAVGWQGVVLNAAMWLFWTLGTISLVWTGGMMILRKADIGEFFAEFVRFILFFGFFLWLLRNGPEYASSIVQSLQRIGEQASGVSSITPSKIVDIGFMILKQAVKNISAWQPIDSLVGLVLSAGILLLLAAVAVNMLLILVSAWILMYAGIFFLGFGGSRWTSDMALNYYKTVLGIAVQLFAMVLLVGIGNDLLSTFYDNMNKGTLNFEELGVMLVFCFALMMLVNRIPPLLSSIISGGGVGAAGGIGNFGTGAALGAAAMAVAAAAKGGAMIAAGAANAAGGAQAVMAAFSKANENVSSGSDVLTSMWGGGGSSPAGGSDGNNSSSTGNTPFAQATGFADSSSSADLANSSPSSADKSNTGEDAKGKNEGGGSDQSKASGDRQTGLGSSETNQQNALGSTAGNGFLASAAKAASTAGKIAADAGANLAKGTIDVAKDKASSIKESAMERIADTTGGKIATAINEQDRGKDNGITFDGNSLASAVSVDAESEIAAFRDRNSSLS
ncbi:P-type conjugative transfer protein TrbL [Methylobacter sp.]|uniref:P-type conjugative transfer protein TrbL n=1 Tax=Methylobacter sp. TaxID=2051955 RepID=UPI003DA5059F